MVQNKIIINERYPDNCDLAATLFPQLHSLVLPCSFSEDGVSDNNKDVIVLFNFS